MKLLHNKKSQEMISRLSFVFWGIILGALFFFIILGKIKDISNDNAFERKYYSKDVALLVDSMQSGNGKFEIDYNVIDLPEGSAFTLELLEDRVVMAHDDANKPKNSFLFAKRMDVIVIPSLIHISSSDDSAFLTSFKMIFNDKEIIFSPLERP